jgi:RimJ/RimL family protein N-acetyltransferase
MRHGFDLTGLPEIVAVTMARNLRSQAVMRRVGMTTVPAEDSTTQTSTRTGCAGRWSTGS